MRRIPVILASLIFAVVIVVFATSDVTASQDYNNHMSPEHLELVRTMMKTPR